MIFDVELHCDKWMDCKTKWCNGDGGFWCNEDCKLLQVNSPSNRKKVEKILSNSDTASLLTMYALIQLVYLVGNSI